MSANKYLDHVLVIPEDDANREMAVGFRHVVLLVDFDSQPNRREEVLKQLAIPARRKDRVFVLGVQSEPENLRTALNLPLEGIGAALAAECREGAFTLWGHNLLRGNLETVRLLRERVCPFLFVST